MAKILRQALRPVSRVHSLQPIPRRAFINLPGLEAQSLSATRILPYKSSSVYALIADVDSYSSFLPYCVDSKITKWSSADKDGKKWPSEADLKVGWGGYEETFTSRLFCVPGSVVEALSGDAVTSLSGSDIEHHSSTLDAPASVNHIFKTIRTRWTVKPFHYKPPACVTQSDETQQAARDRTEVHLTLDFEFSNPIYATLSQAVTPKVAGMMIEAFEVRATKMLDGSVATIQEKN